MEYKGAIFDMDGLLFDTERIYQQTWQEIAAEKGVKLDGSFVKAISGTNGRHMCRVIERYCKVPDGTAIMDECMGRIRRKLSVHVPVKKGVHEILDFFQKKGIRIAVASSEPEPGEESRSRIYSSVRQSGLAALRACALCLRTAKMG